MRNTLLLICAALALMIGSFIWFVATWDRDLEQPIGSADPAQIMNETFRVSASENWSIWQVRGFETHQFGNFGT